MARNDKILKSIDDTTLRDALDWLFNMGFDMERLAQTKHKSTEEHLDLRTVSRDEFLLYMNPAMLYSHIYDPKTKDQLPFYDVLPLYFPIDFRSDRMLAFNIHYMPPATRKMFIANYVRLLEDEAIKRGFANAENLPPMFLQKIGMSYLNELYTTNNMVIGGILRQCVRTYLYSHIMSDLNIVKLKDWGKAVNIILPQFVKQSDSYIYKTIRDEYNRHIDSYRTPLNQWKGNFS
jgi:hypothetical protein